MKGLFLLLGIITAIVGLIPILDSMNKVPAFLSFVPVTGTGYGVIVLLIGAIEIIAAWKQ